MLNEKKNFSLVLPDAPTQNCQKGAERIDKCKKISSQPWIILLQISKHITTKNEKEIHMKNEENISDLV